MNFLYAAFGATWIIHLVYLFTLAARYGRLREDIRQLKKKN